MTFDAHKDRTALRLKLYENGFTPLANRRKMCLIKEWNSLNVTPDLINSREWARSKSFADTGIRCGDVVALDIDIDDKDLINKFLDALIENGIVKESNFVRVGMPPRELWVYRTSDKIGKRTTGHFMPPGAAPDHKGFAVEILGAGCQFAAYGQRDDVTDYSWPVQSLADHQYMDLPEITKAQADAVKDFAVFFFELNGLERKSPAGGTDEGYTHAYDLQPDMVFDVQDMGLMTIAEIGEALQHAPKGEVLRCKVDALRPTTGSWAGMISLVNGQVCISDHGTYTSHFPAAADDHKALERLGALLAERFPDVAPEPSTEEQQPDIDNLPALDPYQPLDVNLRTALRRYVFVENDGLVCDLGQKFMTHKMRAFQDSMAPYYEVKLGPKGGEQRSELALLWRQHPERIAVASMQMRPDMPRPLFRDEDGARHVNTYRPVPHDRFTGGDASIGLRMLANLLPVPGEHKFFMQWLSHKVQHPEIPGPAIIMVAKDIYGTGRGSLISLMTDIFGSDYVSPIDFATLTGQGTQSQYNEWQSESLLVCVDEAKETTSGLSSWQTRSNAYEHLKTVADPSTRNLHVKRKGVKNTKERTYASIFIATNHSDAFIIPANDRRIAVLENGPSEGGDYWDRFHTWRKNRANVAAFVRELLKVDLSDYKPYDPPAMTAAKADMVESGASELDRAFDAAMAGLRDTIVVKEQIILRIEDYLMDNNVEVPDDWQRMVERMLFRKTRKVPAGAPERVRIDGKQRAARVYGKPPGDTFASAEAMLLEISKNGPLTRPIRSTGQVVSFQKRG